MNKKSSIVMETIVYFLMMYVLLTNVSGTLLVKRYVAMR